MAAVDRNGITDSDSAVAGMEARNIVKNFTGLRALAGVNLAVRKGEMVGLIGPNGSGKTTLINILSGALPPSDGEIFIEGKSTRGWAGHHWARRGVCRTFQGIRLFPELTVRENVEAAAAATSSRKQGLSPGERALQALTEVDLLPLCERPAGTLSYGLQRRVEIARALSTQPHYLLLDEPAAGMNDLESGSLLNMIRGAVESHGAGLLVVDHDLKLIMRLCMRVLVLNEGTLIAQGTPDEIQQNESVIEAYLGRRRKKI